MKSIEIQTRQIPLAVWKLSTRAVRRINCGVKVSKLMLQLACLLSTASLAQGHDPLDIARDGTVTINGMVIAPDGTVTINGIVIEPLKNANVAGILSINGSLTLATNEGLSTAGMIRWTGGDFEGFDGKKWSTLTARVTPVANMKRIPPGEFLLNGKIKTLITQGFWMGQYEVTQKEYNAVIGSNPSKFTGNEKLPVDSVEWDDAEFYCAKLTIQDREAGRIPLGYEYRLPTEAEWEYACRAGTTTKYSFGDDEKQLGKYAWCLGNADNTTHPVGEKEANAWGICDMYGNVWEWCQDHYKSKYSDGPLINPKGPVSTDEFVPSRLGDTERFQGEAKGRVVRGGSFGDFPNNHSSSPRSGVPRHSPYRTNGFRVVLALQQ